MANTVTETTNYKLDLYTNTDAPDLTADYVSAMNKIDTQMKVNANASEVAQTAADAAAADAEQALTAVTQDAGDANITAQQLGAAKVNAKGFVYVETS